MKFFCEFVQSQVQLDQREESLLHIFVALGFKIENSLNTFIVHWLKLLVEDFFYSHVENENFTHSVLKFELGQLIQLVFGKQILESLE